MNTNGLQQKIVGAPISGKDADEMFKNMFKEPNNPFKNEYMAAVQILNEINYQYEKELYLNFIEKVIQEKKEEKREAKYEHHQEKQAELQAEYTDSLDREKQKTIEKRLAELDRPDMVPSLIDISYHIDQWQEADSNLQKLAVTRREVHDENVAELKNNANQTITLSNGRQISLALDQDVKEEVNERLENTVSFVDVVGRNPYLATQLRIRENQYLKNTPNPTDQQRIEARQRALSDLNANGNWEIINGYLIKLLRVFADNMRNKLSDDDYEMLAKEYGTKNKFKLAEILLLKNIDVAQLRENITAYNNGYVENNHYRNKHQASLIDIVHYLKSHSNGVEDDAFYERLNKMFGSVTRETILESESQPNDYGVARRAK